MKGVSSMSAADKNSQKWLVYKATCSYTMLAFLAIRKYINRNNTNQRNAKKLKACQFLLRISML
jgi:hypothetical protein